MRKNKFNAIIEGQYTDTWKKLSYKLAHIEIPNPVHTLNDKQYQFRLFGTTNDFVKIKKYQQSKYDLEYIINPLKNCNGIILNKDSKIPKNKKEISYVLETPRAICFEDGRIFVSSYMLRNDELYLDSLQNLLRTAESFFKKEKTFKIYKKYIKLF